MSTPANTAATSNSDNQDAKQQLTFAQQVNGAVSKLVQSEDGNWQFPPDLQLEESVRYAATLEKRRRDTQSALAKTNSALAITQEEVNGLKSLVKKRNGVNLSAAETEELNELKFKDPDAWRQKVTELEQNANSSLDSTLTEISNNAKAKGTIGERQILLQSFLDDNPGLVINDDVIANEIPPRITNELEQGKVTFTEFLNNVKEYISTGKVVADTPIGDVDPNLSEISGSSTPSQSAESGQSDVDYDKAIF